MQRKPIQSSWMVMVLEGILSNRYIPHVPEPKQLAFLSWMGLDGFYGGAAGGGKSDALLMGGLQFVEYPDYNALILRDTYQNLIKPSGILDRATEWLVPTDAHWDGDAKCFRFPSRATLSFGYLDGPRDHFNYQGPEYQYVAIDEGVGVRSHQAMYLFSRLRRITGSKIPIRFRVASNPPTREQLQRGEWVRVRYVDPETRRKGTIFVPAWLKDNPHLDEEEYKRSLNELDPVTREQLLSGNWNIQVLGNMLRKEWFEIVDVVPSGAREVRAWDRAAINPQKQKKRTIEDIDEEGKAKKSAYTSGCRMAEKDGIYYIRHVNRFRGTPLQNEQLIRQQADIDGHAVRIGMEQEPGSSGVDTIDAYRRRVLPEFAFKGYPASTLGSKVVRMMPVASQAEAGNVKVVRGHWNQALLDELEVFPDGPYRDQGDSVSLAFHMLAKKGGGRVRSI